jgi:hypothetical protein
MPMQRRTGIYQMLHPVTDVGTETYVDDCHSSCVRSMSTAT